MHIFAGIKGRQIIAMMMESFRARDRIDVIYTIDHFTKIQYPGDNKLAKFKATWLEVIGRMRPEDVPSKNALRDLLHLKIKGSNLMKLELQLLYEIHAYDDAERSYEKLLQIMDRAIARQRESKNLHDTNTGLHQLVQGRHLLAAPAPEPKAHPHQPPPAPPNAKAEGGGKGKGKGEANDAAPVYAQAEAKRRAKEKAKAKAKAKGGGGRQRSTSTNRDTSRVRCKFFFSSGGCTEGDQCRFSRKEKEPKKGKGKGKGRPRSGSPSATSLEGSPGADPSSKNCFQWMRGGKCNREACPYKHDPSYATPAKDGKAKAKAEAKEKAKSKAKAKATPAKYLWHYQRRHSPRRSPRDAAEYPLWRLCTVGSSQPRDQVPHSRGPPNAAPCPVRPVLRPPELWCNVVRQWGVPGVKTDSLRAGEGCLDCRTTTQSCMAIPRGPENPQRFPGQ